MKIDLCIFPGLKEPTLQKKSTELNAQSHANLSKKKQAFLNNLPLRYIYEFDEREVLHKREVEKVVFSMSNSLHDAPQVVLCYNLPSSRMRVNSFFPVVIKSKSADVM